jgi:3-methyladenine DNA glycosylase AlkD
MVEKIQKDLNKLKNNEKAKILQGFFKTGIGQYGEGDKFLGIVVPLQREVAKKYYKDCKINDLQILLDSKIHEHRQVALFILNYKFQSADAKEQEQIYKLYLKNTKNINNWDLVDLSAPNIVGKFLLDKDRSILYKLAKSNNLWEKRISILSTFWFIKNNDFNDSIKIAQMLLNDKHDLIHKAIGWMLREIGKRDIRVEKEFLDKNFKTMPRTALRYAIEKFPENVRSHYLKPSTS